jgi:hypothetical protein
MEPCQGLLEWVLPEILSTITEFLWGDTRSFLMWIQTCKEIHQLFDPEEYRSTVFEYLLSTGGSGRWAEKFPLTDKIMTSHIFHYRGGKMHGLCLMQRVVLKKGCLLSQQWFPGKYELVIHGGGIMYDDLECGLWKFGLSNGCYDDDVTAISDLLRFEKNHDERMNFLSSLCPSPLDRDHMDLAYDSKIPTREDYLFEGMNFDRYSSYCLCRNASQILWTYAVTHMVKRAKYCQAMRYDIVFEGGNTKDTVKGLNFLPTINHSAYQFMENLGQRRKWQEPRVKKPDPGESSRIPYSLENEITMLDCPNDQSNQDDDQKLDG